MWKYSTLKGRPRVAHAHMRAEDPTLGAVYQVAKVPEEPVLNSGANHPEYKHLHPQRANVTLANGVKVTDPFFATVCVGTFCSVNANRYCYCFLFCFLRHQRASFRRLVTINFKLEDCPAPPN